MKCHVCGSENEIGKFCTKCGSPLQTDQVAASAEASPNQHPQQQGFQPNQGNFNQQQYQQGYGYQQNQYQGNHQQQPYGGGYQQHPNQQYPNQQQPNEYVEKGKEVSKQYFSFFINSLKDPVRFGNTVNGNYWINGLITLILSVLILSLSFANYISRIMDVSGLSYFGADEVLGLSFGSVFLKGILFLGIFAAIVLAVIFGIVKMLNNVNVNFKDIIARSGSFATVPTLIFVLFFLVTFIDSQNIILFVTTLINAAFIISVTLSIVSFRTNAKLDLFYSLLIAMAIFAIVQIIGLNTMLEGMMNRIMGGFDLF